MKDNKIQITLSISKDCYDAMRFLRKKKISARNLLRGGGEKLVIETANKNKFTKAKLECPSLIGVG